MEKNAGNTSTFVVQVKFCQNASWQGTVSWIDGKREQHFRSTLELLKLIDEALVSEHGDGGAANWE